MRTMAILTAISIASATPLLANGQGLAAQDCHAYASGVGYSGAKGGYSASYLAAYNACLEQHASYSPGPIDYRQPRNKSSVTAYCPPNAPVMYRGTQYCRN